MNKLYKTKKLIIVILFFKSILYPSYLSVAHVCGQISDEELEDAGFLVGGRTTPLPNGTIKVEVFIEDLDNEVKKHEYIHVKQLQKGFLSSSCKDYVQKFLGEIEAKIFDDLPDNLFRIIYGDFDEK